MFCPWLHCAKVERLHGNPLAWKAKWFVMWPFTEEICAPLCPQIYWRHRPQRPEGWGLRGEEKRILPQWEKWFLYLLNPQFSPTLDSNTTGLLWDCTTAPQGPNLTSNCLRLVHFGLVLLLQQPYLLCIPPWCDGSLIPHAASDISRWEPGRAETLVKQLIRLSKGRDKVITFLSSQCKVWRHFRTQ